jgi:hypothetical protein
VVIVVAAWMLDPAGCAGMAIGAPRVAISALVDLHHLLAYSDEFERWFQSIVNAGSDDFERAGVRRWWWFSFHFGSVRSRGRSSP